jgi:hypothetical protein
VGPTSPHLFSFLKHSCHLIAIWALIIFPRVWSGYSQVTAIYHFPVPFWSVWFSLPPPPFNACDSVFLGPPGALQGPGPRKSVTPVTPSPGHWRPVAMMRCVHCGPKIDIFPKKITQKFWTFFSLARSHPGVGHWWGKECRRASDSASFDREL